MVEEKHCHLKYSICLRKIGVDMTELWIAGSVLLALVFGTFSVFWKIIQDVKKSLHARIDRNEDKLTERENHCTTVQEKFISIGAFDRFEKHLGSRFDGVKSEVGSLTKRIDDLVFTIRQNGKARP